MKIKGKLIIPLVAIIIAMCTVGATPGFAGDTQPGSSVVDSLTYVPPTTTAEIPLEDQIGGMLSSAMGDDLQNIGGSILENGGIFNGALTSLRDFLKDVVAFFEKIGLVLGSGSLNLGGGIFG